MSKIYRIVVKKSVQKDVRRIPCSILARLRELIEDLAADPYPREAQKIKGYNGFYRIRCGDYRVIYQVASEIRIITIYKIGHRRDIYRRFSDS